MIIVFRFKRHRGWCRCQRGVLAFGFLQNKETDVWRLERGGGGEVLEGVRGFYGGECNCEGASFNLWLALSLSLSLCLWGLCTMLKVARRVAQLNYRLILMLIN